MCRHTPKRAKGLCKTCYCRAYYRKNAKHLLQRQKDCRKRYAERVKQYKKLYRKINADKCRAGGRKYYKTHLAQKLRYAARFRIKNKFPKASAAVVELLVEAYQMALKIAKLKRCPHAHRGLCSKCYNRSPNKKRSSKTYYEKSRIKIMEKQREYRYGKKQKA